MRGNGWANAGREALRVAGLEGNPIEKEHRVRAGHDNDHFKHLGGRLLMTLEEATLEEVEGWHGCERTRVYYVDGSPFPWGRGQRRGYGSFQAPWTLTRQGCLPWKWSRTLSCRSNTSRVGAGDLTTRPLAIVKNQLPAHGRNMGDICRSFFCLKNCRTFFCQNHDLFVCRHSSDLLVCLVVKFLFLYMI